jgi:hypothetical protein
MSAFKKSFKLLGRKEMILLSLTFFYTGIELSFFSGVYSSAVGFTSSLGKEAKRLVGLCGILVGAGEVLGGATFGLLGGKSVKRGMYQRTKHLMRNHLNHNFWQHCKVFDLPILK